MQVLEDHNRQLEAQLQRLRQLLDQVQREVTITKNEKKKSTALVPYMIVTLAIKGG